MIDRGGNGTRASYMHLGTNVPRDTGWYAEKLYVKLRYQVRGEPVPPNGLQDPSFRSIYLCDGWVKGPGLAN